MFDIKSQSSEMPARKPRKRQLDSKSVPRCPYSSKKLSKGAFPLPPLITSVGSLYPVHSIILRSVMGGCEIVDYANDVERTEERLVVDLSMIGIDFSEPGPIDATNRNSSFHQRSLYGSIDGLMTPETPLNLKENLSLMESQKFTNNNNNNNQGSCGNQNYGSSEYTNFIEGMINNAYDSVASIKTIDKQNNNNNNENNYEFFNYDNNEIVDLTPSEPESSPVIISLQNYYDPLNTPQTTTRINHFHPPSNSEGTVSTPSPVSALDISSEESQYCNLDTLKVFRENLEEVSYSDVQVNVQPNHSSLGTRGQGAFDTFFEFDSVGQRIVPRTNMPRIPPVAKETISQSNDYTPRRRKKHEQRVQSNWDKGKRINCSLCSKMFRTAAHLKTHFVVHSMSEGLKPSRCGVCNKGFCHRGALTLHMRSHTCKIKTALAFNPGEY